MRLRRLLLSSVSIALVILGAETYILDLYHEEPRRLLVADSMLKHDKWIVPHILGEIYLKKPPGFNWFVAMLSLPFGEVTRFTGRLAGILSWGITGGAVFWFTYDESRELRYTATLASLFPLTIFIEKAAFAELDLFLTALTTISLVLWFTLRRQNRYTLAWILGHCVLILGFFTKGPVAYLFFYPPIALYLIISDEQIDWSGFLSGFLLSHLVLGLWVIAFLNQVGYSTIRNTLLSETVSRGESQILPYMKELITFPIVTLLSLSPWTLFLCGIYRKKVWTAISTRIVSSKKGLLTVSAVTPFIFFWLFPVDNVRYVLPIFPWVAVGIGFVFEHIVKQISDTGYLIPGINIMAGILCLTIVLPWILEIKQGVITFTSVLFGCTVLTLIGIGIFWYSRRASSSIYNCLGIALLFIISLKIGYLAIYVPVDDPALLTTRTTIIDWIDARRISKNTTIIFRSNASLDIPYYLQKRGYRIIKNTKSKVSNEGRYFLTQKQYKGPKSPALKLPTGHTFYLYKRPQYKSIRQTHLRGQSGS